MGLDPFTSSAIAAYAADETGNDATVPLAVTAGPYAPAADSAYEGDYEQAGTNAALASAAVAGGAALAGGAGAAGAGAGAAGAGGTGAAGAGAAGAGAAGGGAAAAGGTGLGAATLGAGALQAGGAVAGQYLQGQAAENVAEINASTNQTVPNPYYDAMMTRWMGVIDAYMQKHGIPRTIGINPKAPENTAGMSAPGLSAAPPIPPTDSVTQSPPTAPMPAQPPTQTGATQVPSAPGASVDSPTPAIGMLEGEGYTNAALAAQLGRQRLGMNADPKLATTKDFLAQDQARKSEELNKLFQYIYGQRTALGGSKGPKHG